MSSKFTAAGKRVMEETYYLLTVSAQTHAISALRNVNLAPTKLPGRLGSVGEQMGYLVNTIWATPGLTVVGLKKYIIFVVN